MGQSRLISAIGKLMTIVVFLTIQTWVLRWINQTICKQKIVGQDY